jgi:hypothetical protein
MKLVVSQQGLLEHAKTAQAETATKPSFAQVSHSPNAE